MDAGKIILQGARQHNLKNIDLEIPKGQLVVFSGVSGSGKSSLAFDTIYAEGQRRYVESLSAYARQFLERMDKPVVRGTMHLEPTGFELEYPDGVLAQGMYIETSHLFISSLLEFAGHGVFNGAVHRFDL